MKKNKRSDKSKAQRVRKAQGTIRRHPRKGKTLVLDGPIQERRREAVREGVAEPASNVHWSLAFRELVEKLTSTPEGRTAFETVRRQADLMVKTSKRKRSPSHDKK